MIDVVYILGTGSQFHNHEIRFSLRSVEKHLKNVGKVWVIGEHHPVIQNVNFIPYPDRTIHSATNIMHKVTRACEEKEISENFLFFNDDHYLLTDFDAETFPYFYSGTIQEFLSKRDRDAYTKKVENTYQHLKDKGLPLKFFDVHTPIIYNKAKFLENVANSGIDWNNAPCVSKSVYANSMGIEGVKESDHKTDRPPINAKIFSTGTRVSAAVQRFLLEQFPVKCSYERRDF